MRTNKTLLNQAIATAIITSALFGTTAYADEYHYRDIIVGDRAAGLGGAYTAIADDASGLYYNPAGVVYASTPKISGSVNAYNYKSTEYSNINSSGHTWTRKSSGMVANYFGVVQPMGDATVGFSIAIPNYDLEDQSDDFRNFTPSKKAQSLGMTEINNQQIDFNNQDSTTLAGVSYGTAVSDSFSWGVTLYGYMRKKELTNWQYIKATGVSGGNNVLLDGTYYQKIQTEELGLQPRLGLMWAPAQKWSVGLMVQATSILSQSPETRSNSTYNLCTESGAGTGVYTNCSVYDNGLNPLDLGQATTSELLKGTENQLPVETNLGVAYFASDSLLYTADFSYATQTDVYEAVWNVAGGMEYFLDQTWALRGGLYTNNANTNSDVSTYKKDHVNMYGGAFSVTRYTKGSNITAGINYATGSGEADLFNSSSRVQNVSINSVNMFISTSASF